MLAELAGVFIVRLDLLQIVPVGPCVALMQKFVVILSVQGTGLTWRAVLRDQLVFLGQLYRQGPLILDITPGPATDLRTVLPAVEVADHLDRVILGLRVPARDNRALCAVVFHDVFLSALPSSGRVGRTPATASWRFRL